MKYLLVDFGASYIKNIVYDTDSKNILYSNTIDSPFKTSKRISRSKLKNILINIIEKTSNIDGIIICTIIGGGWIDDIYYSWQSDNKNVKEHCLISGLFINSRNYHVHAHHKYNSLSETQDNLEILGKIKNIPIYSSLGDTNCVIKSLDLKNNEYIINIGTGSQVIYKDRDNKININKYIPAGRALLVYDNFFKTLGLNFFKMLKTIKPEDVYASNLNINLNLFEQAFDYVNGGSISNINEDNLTINNLLGSILRCLVLQYKQFIKDKSKNTLILTGGIPKKLPILKKLFKFYYSNYKIKIILNNIEDTHLGMIRYLEDKLENEQR
jgi:hypothetical protein